MNNIDRCLYLVRDWASSKPEKLMNPKYTLAIGDRCNEDCHCMKKKKHRQHPKETTYTYMEFNIDNKGKLFTKYKKIKKRR